MIYVNSDTYSKLMTDEAIVKGSVALNLDGIVKDSVDRYSLQLTETKHLHPREDTEESRVTSKWAFLNHSCDPNTEMNVENLQLLAKKDIAENGELTFDYETTETNMAEPFKCNCGSANCRGLIKGKAHKN